MEENKYNIPIWKKINLTVKEASALSGIGEHRIRELTDDPKCGYVLWVGSKRLVKRKQFEKYLENEFSV